MVSSVTPTSRRISSTATLRRLSSSSVRAEHCTLSYQTIVHASIAGRTWGCQVATTVSFNNTTASQKAAGPSVVRIPTCVEDESSDDESSGSSTCSCDDCRDASTGTMTPSTVVKSPPSRQARRVPSTRMARSTASALPPTSKLLSPPSRRLPSGRPSSVPPTASRPTSAPTQSRRSSIAPPLERYMSNVSSPSDTNSLRSQQGSVVSQLVSARRPTSAPTAGAPAVRRSPPSCPADPSIILPYGEFHPLRDSAMWKNKKASNQASTPKKSYTSPRHNVIKSKNNAASPTLCFESCQGSTAVGLSATSASTAMMAKFPAWQHEQLRQNQGPTPIVTEGLHASAWGHLRMASPKKPNVRGGSNKNRRTPPPHPSEPSVIDLECGSTPTSVTKETSKDTLGETSNSMKILNLDNWATKLRFVLIIIVTFLLLVASLALYYDLKVANKETV